MEQKPDKKKKERRTGQRTKTGRDKWLLRVFLGKDSKQHRRYHTETFHGSATQAEARIRELIRRNQSGEPLKLSKDSFGLFLDEWLESKKLSVAESSFKIYRVMLDTYLRPHFGKMMMSSIRAEDIQRAYNKMADQELGPTTIRQVHKILAMIFKLAVQRKKLSSSPLVGVAIPKQDGEVKEAKAMSLEEVARFLDAARGRRLERVFILAFHIGCRPGELLALKWSNLEREAIRIDQAIVWRKAGDWYLKSTKTTLSRRTIALTPIMVYLLLEQKEWQEATRAQHSRVWEDHGFIFTNERGEPFSQWNLRDEFKAIIKQSGLPWRFNPYSARHTMATLLLQEGADVKSVSERLGHANAVMTLNVYSHVLPGRQAQMSEKIERLLTVGNAQTTEAHPTQDEGAQNQQDTGDSCLTLI